VKSQEFILKLQQELRRHHFETFVDEPPTVAQGGRSVVAPGCTLCRVRLNTHSQFMNHLVAKVLPEAIEKILLRGD